jgi:hypothetical protein
MNAEFDFDLTPDQWETLKALRVPASQFSRLNRRVLEDLARLQLATIDGPFAVITPLGRKVLIRGSSRLWDVAA